MTSVIFQSEQSECGLASLAMIASHYGYRCDLMSLRQRLGAYSQGMSVMDIVDAAGKINMGARGVRLELDELPHLSLPAILHWEMNHFVVLDKIKSGTYYIRDPAAGRRVLGKSQVSGGFSGIAIELYPEEAFVAEVDKRKTSLLGLWKGNESVFSPMSQIVILSALVEMVSLAVPFLLQAVTDELIPSRDIGIIGIVSAFALGLMALQASGGGLRSKLVELLRASLFTKMSGKMFMHMLRLPAQYFHVRHYGDIQSRFHSMDQIQSRLSGPLITCLFDSIASVIALTILFIYSHLVAILCVAVIVLYCILRWFLHEPTVAANEEVIISTAKKESLLLESIRGVETLKTYSKSRVRASHFHNAICDIASGQLEVARHSIRYEFLSMITLSISVIGTIGLGALLAVRGEISVGMLVAIFGFRTILVSRAIAAFDGLMQIRLLDMHAQRVSELVDQELEDEVHHALPEDENCCIEFRNVSFRYEGTRNQIMENLSFSVPRGASLALVGRSGVGKTTIGKLACGLLVPTSGSVYLGNERANGGSSGKGHTAVVSQSEVMFSGTVLDNIVLWDPEYDDRRLRRAAEMACILDDVNAMTMGFNSYIGEGGSMLSGGQRQRIAIARALYVEPSILILDEATSNLDLQTEKNVLSNVSSLGITVLQIAHRPQAIRDCDLILDLAEKPPRVRANNHGRHNERIPQTVF